MNPVTITVQNPDELIDGFGVGARINLQTSTASDGTFVDVTTIPLVSGTRSYTYEHLAGISSTWYQVRYEDSDGANADDWSDPFQTGDENAGMLCSLYDVQQELADTSFDNELILAKIRQVSAAIEGYCGRWFAPRPTDPSSTTTYRFNTQAGFSLWVPKGIRSITTLSVAFQDQPDTGGSFATCLSTDYSLQPTLMDRAVGWPAIRVQFLTIATGANAYFVNAFNGAEITGSFGFAAVPYDIQGIAVRAATRRVIGKGGGGISVAVGPSGREILLPDLSGADRTTLDQYKHWAVG